MGRVEKDLNDQVECVLTGSCEVVALHPRSILGSGLGLRYSL